MTNAQIIVGLAENIGARDLEIEQLKTLIARAADALEGGRSPWDLILELRKAAE